ncbi:MAG: hypothetical protein IJ120_11815 [Solobacterium sp.]|nr:hypothetical protein [Solobacterium sp.]
MTKIKEIARIVLAVILPVAFIAGIAAGRELDKRSKDIVRMNMIAVEVTDDQGQLLRYETSTYAVTVTEVLDELQESGVFTYVTRGTGKAKKLVSVNGVSADLKKNTSSWVVQIFGEEIKDGLDDHAVQAGDIISIVYAKDKWD